MRSKAIGVYATVALASIVVYVIATFTQGATPRDSHEWITFSLMGVILAVLASAIIGSFVIARGRRKNHTTTSE